MKNRFRKFIDNHRKRKYLFNYSELSPWEKEVWKTIYMVWRPIIKKYRFRIFIARLKNYLR